NVTRIGTSERQAADDETAYGERGKCQKTDGNCTRCQGAQGEDSAPLRSAFRRRPDGTLLGMVIDEFAHFRQPPLTFDAGTLPRRADKDQGMEKMARTVARSMAHSAEVTARIAPMNTAEKRRPSVPERLVILAV